MDAVSSDRAVLKSRSWMTSAILVLGICGFFLAQHRAEAMWGQPQVKIVVEDMYANLTEPTH